MARIEPTKPTGPTPEYGKSGKGVPPKLKEGADHVMDVAKGAGLERGTPADAQYSTELPNEQAAKKVDGLKDWMGQIPK